MNRMRFLAITCNLRAPARLLVSVSRRNLTALVIVCSLLVSAGTKSDELPELPAPATQNVDFDSDVLPIFKETCFRCHGPDRQESGYRLDVKEIAMEGGDAYAPNIIPGRSADSPLIRILAGVLDGQRMPAEGDPLSTQQIAILRAWIDQGANWPDASSAKIVDKSDWWAWRSLRASPPSSVDGSTIIDAYVQSKLKERGLEPAPQADARILIRRLYFDLTGLPPTPEEVDAFSSSTDIDAYEKLVDRLLASPRYGERWARFWMDAAHFAETHGHDQDRIRENAWPYRDYLIESFNSDKPYGRFIAEQVAGDELFPDDPQATVALAFLAAGPWDESSLRDIREDTLDRQIGRYLDRDDMLANVFNNVTSVTIQCARCHDHKFDPIPQSEYYSLQAVFSGIERANRTFDRDPQVHRQRLDLLERKKALEIPTPAMQSQLLASETQQDVRVWEEAIKTTPDSWRIGAIDRFSAAEGTTLTPQPDGSLLASGARPETDIYTFVLNVPAGKLTAIRLDVLADETLPRRGPGRQDNGNLHLSEIEVFRGDGTNDRIAIASARADFDQEGWEASKAIDGDEKTAWGVHPQVGQPHEVVFELREPVNFDADGKVTVVLKQLHGRSHLIGRPRLSITSAWPTTGLAVIPEEVAKILSIPNSERTNDQSLTIALFQQRLEVDRQIAALPPPSYIYAAARDFIPDGSLKPVPAPRTVHVLRRGDIRQPLAESQPGALSCVGQIPATFEIPDATREGLRRAALAGWLSHRENPLTWRSIVNRIWQHHFGRGLVATPNDFGRMGSVPTHSELLDALAIRFRDSGQSIKQLHRWIVTSSTYRRTSRPSTSEASVADPENHYLSRMHRTRLDAECVRDAVLTISDQLDLRMGGPSDRQFEMKPGRHVTPILNYEKFDFDGPAGRRRSIYRFLFRTLPDPFMESLDCPAGDQITPVRVNSVTVQQALAMWNDAFMVRHCEHFAARLERLADTSEDRVRWAFRFALGREPRDEELADFAGYADRHGTANLCRLIFNLNEFIFVD